MKRFITAVLFGCLALGPASACMEAPELTHAREIALLDKGLETSKRDQAVIIRVKALRDRADGAFKAHQLGRAWKDRRHALIILGYTIGQGPAADGPPKAVAPVNLTGPSGCIGGATFWQAPAE